jgi:MFS family permease
LVTAAESIPWRVQGAVYGTAFFNGNLFAMSHVVVPLWAAIELEASLLMVGVIVSSRQLLPVTMSIHGGALLDRFGPRRVITTLGLIGALCTMSVPLLPFIWATIMFQVLIGFCETTNWIGVQSAVGTLMRGEARFAGRMTAAARTGGFFGPILVGVAYESYGPIGGFGLFGLWGLLGAIGAIFLPKHASADAATAGRRSMRASTAAVMPRLSDYHQTFRLLVLPAIALVIAATFMRQTGSGVQSSFYGVWLKEIGYTAGFIGILIGISNGVSAVSALSVGPLTQRFADYWLLILAIGCAIVGIAVTPLFDEALLLAIAISVRGLGQGLNLPLMMSIASRAVARDLQGRVAALRITFNRFGSALFPVIMGAIAEVIGLEAAFYVVGAAGVLMLCFLAAWVHRSRDQFTRG